MAVLANLARMTTATTGTGTITFVGAATGFLTFAQAGISNGQTVSYAIEDGTSREVGRGVYSSTGPTLTRSVLKSTNSNAAISLSGNAQVFITALAEDLLPNGLGIDQTWQGVTRAYDTSYQNTSGKPIICMGYSTSDGYPVNMYVSVNNTTWELVGTGLSQTLSGTWTIDPAYATVPPGHYFKWTSAFSLGGMIFKELR